MLISYCCSLLEVDSYTTSCLPLNCYRRFFHVLDLQSVTSLRHLGFPFFQKQPGSYGAKLAVNNLTLEWDGTVIKRLFSGKVFMSVTFDSSLSLHALSVILTPVVFTIRWFFYSPLIKDLLVVHSLRLTWEMLLVFICEAFKAHLYRIISVTPATEALVMTIQCHSSHHHDLEVRIRLSI